METVHGDRCPADSATRARFIGAASAFAALPLKPNPILSSLIKEVKHQRRAVTCCLACRSIEYPACRTRSKDYADLQTVYRFLQFEGFMYAAFLEEIPQQARVLAQGIMYRIVNNSPSLDRTCSLCSVNACEGTGRFTVTYCRHIFHTNCLFKSITKHGEWNKSHRSHCPKCSTRILSLYPPGAEAFGAVKERWEEKHGSEDAALLLSTYVSQGDASNAQAVARTMIETVRMEISADKFTEDSLERMIIYMWIDIKLSKNQGTAKEEATQNLKFAKGASEILLSRSEDSLYDVGLDWNFYEDFTVEELCKELS